MTHFRGSGIAAKAGVSLCLLMAASVAHGLGNYGYVECFAVVAMPDGFRVPGSLAKNRGNGFPRSLDRLPELEQGAIQSDFFLDCACRSISAISSGGTALLK